MPNIQAAYTARQSTISPRPLPLVDAGDWRNTGGIRRLGESRARGKVAGAVCLAFSPAHPPTLPLPSLPFQPNETLTPTAKRGEAIPQADYTGPVPRTGALRLPAPMPSSPAIRCCTSQLRHGSKCTSHDAREHCSTKGYSARRRESGDATPDTVLLPVECSRLPPDIVE